VNIAFRLVIVAIAVAPCRAESDRSTTAAFLQARHNPDGGYSPSISPTEHKPKSSLRATLAAMRALHYFAGVPKDLDAMRRFVLLCRDAKTGGFADAPGETPTVPFTAIGVMAAVELKIAPEQFRDAAITYLNENAKTLDDIRIAAAAFEALKTKPRNADAWLRQIAATRNADGAFGAGSEIARTTGGMIVTILRLGGTFDRKADVVKALRAGQRSDGGFGGADKTESDLVSSYRVMRAFAMLKEQPAHPDKLRSFVSECRSPFAGGYSERPYGQPSVAATYYAAMVLGWLDGK